MRLILIDIVTDLEFKGAPVPALDPEVISARCFELGKVDLADRLSGIGILECLTGLAGKNDLVTVRRHKFKVVAAGELDRL